MTEILTVPQYSLSNLNKKVVYYVVNEKKIYRYLAYDGTGLQGRKKKTIRILAFTKTTLPNCLCSPSEVFSSDPKNFACCL